MNVIFHTLSSVAIVVMVANVSKPLAKMEVCSKMALAFTLGIIVHGVLDYIPHRYPVNSKIDAIASLAIMLFLIFKAKRSYRGIVVASIFGCIFPDIVDLSSSIFNKYLHLHLPIIQKIFPWHWPQYSGSVYDGGYAVSLLNHMIVLILIFIICMGRRKTFKAIFLSEENNLSKENR